jgi:hypothetical protein
MPLPNCDVDYHICLGNTWAYIAQGMIERKTKYSLAEMAEAVIGYFWNSSFNNDLCDSFVNFARSNPEVRNLKTWQENSTKDPLFILKCNWVNDTRLSSFLDREGGERDPARLNTARIVDRVLVDASRRLTEYLKMAGQVTATSQRSADIMKNALFESMTTSCGRVLDLVKGKMAEEKAAEEKKIIVEPDRIKRYQDGDFLYHPPTVEVW